MALELQKDFVLFLQGFRNVFTELFFNLVSFFGEPEFYILLLGFVYWVLNKKAGEMIGITLGFSLSLNNILKAIFHLERPFITYSEIENLRASTATGSAFPSGHAQGSASLFFALAFAFKKRFLFIIAIIMAILMMFSRMFLGVHYFQDVLAGTLIAILIAYGVYLIFKKYYEQPLTLHRIYALMIALLLPAVILVDINDFFRGYGIFVGLVLAIVIEKRFVNFTYAISWQRKIVRYLGGVLLLLLTMNLLGLLFGLAPDDFKNALDFVRFFFVALIGFGIYPMIFTKLKF